MTTNRSGTPSTENSANTLTSEHKSDFSTIYTNPDPRGYFRTLAPLRYQVPQRALPVVRAVLAASGADTVLDVCCSYGINAALLRHRVDLDDVSERACDPARRRLSAEDVIRTDERFYALRRRAGGPSVLGLDCSAPAIDYALRTGLLDDGWAEDLEAGAPSPALAEGLRDVGLVVCTGGVGYVGRRTFERIAASVGEPRRLWFATFVLRVFDFADIAAGLARHGLLTERVPGVSFRQRRFADADEAAAARHDVLALGLDPAGKEDDGWYHADCYLTRPATDAATTPVTDLLADALPA